MKNNSDATGESWKLYEAEEAITKTDQKLRMRDRKKTYWLTNAVNKYS